MTTSKSKSKALDTLPTIQHGVEQALAIVNLTGQGESIRSKINSTAMAWFLPFAEAGADAEYLKAYSGKNEKNNLKRTVRDYFVQSCAIACVGQSGLTFLEDKNNGPDAEYTATEGTLTGSPRTKKYIQQQYGKIISAVGTALKQAVKDAENGENGDDKEKTKKSDCDRALEGIAKANTQAMKGKPDGSMSPELVEACTYMYDIANRLKNGESFATIIHADYFAPETK